MTFKDWIYSSYENPEINGRWKLLHILTLISCIAIIITLALVFRRKNDKAKRIVIFVLSGLILFFEILRRIISFLKGSEFTLNSVLHTLLPRPWCAISCWVLILAPIINKKWYYNFASTTALLCSSVFFAYPGVGFNNKYILFENLYSIATHSLLFITSITLITLSFTNFKYKDCWKELIALIVVYIYAILEIYVLKIENDPLYFMYGNDIQTTLNLNYGVFLTLYILAVLIYFNLFYIISDRKALATKLKKNKNK